MTHTEHRLPPGYVRQYDAQRRLQPSPADTEELHQLKEGLIGAIIPWPTDANLLRELSKVFPVTVHDREWTPPSSTHTIPITVAVGRGRLATNHQPQVIVAEVISAADKGMIYVPPTNADLVYVPKGRMTLGDMETMMRKLIVPSLLPRRSDG